MANSYFLKAQCLAIGNHKTNLLPKPENIMMKASCSFEQCKIIGSTVNDLIFKSH